MSKFHRISLVLTRFRCESDELQKCSLVRYSVLYSVTSNIDISVVQEILWCTKVADTNICENWIWRSHISLVQRIFQRIKIFDATTSDRSLSLVRFSINGFVITGTRTIVMYECCR